MRRMISFAVTLPVFLHAAIAVPADRRQPVRLIFDTDIQTDVDDVGATALLHALADRGEVEILAMGVSGKLEWCAPCLHAVNTWYGRPEIPIGELKGAGVKRRSRYARQVAEEFPHKLRPGEAPDAAKLYRRVLAAQPDGSVVMVSVGYLTNFRDLLKTGPDEHSPLEGKELVRKKVRAWVCMGPKFPSGKECNIVRDPAASVEAINNWPTAIIFSGSRIGNKIKTGARLKETPKTNPVRRAYELYNGLNNRQSWDQTAVLYAARGLDGGLSDYWDLETTGSILVKPDGSNQWRREPDRDHSYLVKKKPPAEIARVIEDLMLLPPTRDK